MPKSHTKGEDTKAHEGERARRDTKGKDTKAHEGLMRRRISRLPVLVCWEKGAGIFC